MDEYNNAFEFPVKENLKKNLVLVMDDCVRNIIKAKEAQCKKVITNTEEVKEIKTGIVLTKNLKETRIAHDCNNLDIKLKGNYLVEFRNCKIELNNKSYENFETKFYDKILLPNYVTKIKEKEIVQELSLNDLHTENIQNREKLDMLHHKSHKTNIINISISSIILTSVIIFIILKISQKYIRKSKNSFDSPESHTNGRGVTTSVQKKTNNLIILSLLL